MGPPPFGDGNPHRGATNLASRCTFNGATAFRRWKPSYGRDTSVEVADLQWGHRLSAMETRLTVSRS